MKRFNGTSLLLLIAFSYCLIQGSFYPLLILLFSTLHEFGHFIAIRLMGGKVASIGGKSQGIQIQFSDLNYQKEFIAALAGPMVNFILAAVFGLMLWKAKEISFAYCLYANLFLGILNLIPIFPLDGGRMLACILSCFTDPFKKQKILHRVGIFFLIILLGIAFWQFLISGYNYSLLFICIYLLMLISAQSKGDYL